MSECVFKKSCDLIDLAKEKNTFQLPPFYQLNEWKGETQLYLRTHRSPQGSTSCQAGNLGGSHLIRRLVELGKMKEYTLSFKDQECFSRVHVLPIRRTDTNEAGWLIGRPYGANSSARRLLRDAVNAELSKTYKLVLKNIRPNPHGVTLNRPSLRGRVECELHGLSHIQQLAGLTNYVWIDELQRGYKF